MTELMKRESNAMTTRTSGTNGFDGDPSDILIPKLLIGQAISEVVQQSLVGNGEIYRSTTKTKLGGNGEPVAFIPLSMKKVWNLYAEENGKKKFKGKEVFTALNANDPWEWVEDGVKKSRMKVLEFYGLLPGEISDDIEMRKELEETGDMPDLDKALLPVLLCFQSTSYKQGQVLATHFAKAAEFNVGPYTNFFLIDTELVKGDKGRYGEFRVGKGGKTAKEFMESCKKWQAIVSAGKVAIDEEEPLDIQGTHVEASSAPLDIENQF